MKSHLIVTITCPDRPGVVERVTEVLVKFNANWEESRLARLGGDFAGIVRISVPPEKQEALAEALRGLSREAINATVRTGHAEAAPLAEGYTLCALRLTGADHEGIVHRVAAYLASQGVNVEAMETEIVPAPVTATPLFQMQAQLKVPAHLPLEELAGSLQQIGEALGTDIEINSGGAQ